MAADDVIFASAAEGLVAAPIRPEWIRAGAPVARASELSRSRDGTATTHGWDCTAGEFDWFFGGDETVYIIEGEVFVADPASGGERRLGPGDVALFRAGTWSRWRVPVYVRKLAFCRHPLPAPLGLALRAWRKLWSLARGGANGGLAAAPQAVKAGGT
ncbi:MAG: DUF861 domain-containing protein [Hyphomicrobiaceae bacterium]|nr:DUF861 domain-containing protein [Hyphomicrobiaceae bacterium]